MSTPHVLATKTPDLSISYGFPLETESGIGSLTLPGYLQEVTRKFSPSEALVYYSDSDIVRWSYADLWNEAQTVARSLIAAGMQKGDRVGVLMTNRPEFLAAVFGVSCAGGVGVPLNTFATPSELEYLIQAAEISILLFERHIAGKDYVSIVEDLEPATVSGQAMALASKKLPNLRHLVVLDAQGAFQNQGAIEAWTSFLTRAEGVSQSQVDALMQDAGPEDPAMLFFSSGTTSLPKGILHSHQAVTLQWWRWPRLYAVNNDARVWTANGFFWSGPFSLVLGVALSSGGAIILQSAFQADQALQLMQDERVTVPIAKRHQWARMEGLESFLSTDLSHLHYVDVKKYIHVEHPKVRTDWHDVRAYGATETLTNSTAIPSDVPYDATSKIQGLPLPGNIFKVIDPETRAILPLGEHGELAVKGPTLMLGYLGKNPEDTFDEDGFFLTGDGGYIDPEGYIFWEGRLNDMIKTGGANVAPDEVDKVITTYPGVRLTQTVGIPDDMMGEIVVSCIVPQRGVELEEAHLRAFLKEHLASYKIPKTILWFEEREMAMTGSGAKIKAREIKARAIARLAAA